MRLFISTCWHHKNRMFTWWDHLFQHVNFLKKWCLHDGIIYLNMSTSLKKDVNMMRSLISTCWLPKSRMFTWWDYLFQHVDFLKKDVYMIRSFISTCWRPKNRMFTWWDYLFQHVDFLKKGCLHDKIIYLIMSNLLKKNMFTWWDHLSYHVNFLKRGCLHDKIIFLNMSTS